MGRSAYYLWRLFDTRILSVPVAIAGFGWIVDGLAPYFAPDLDLGWAFYAIFGELIPPAKRPPLFGGPVLTRPR